MVEVKAIRNDERDGVSCTCKFDGEGITVAGEVCSAISAMMKGLKDTDPILHLAVIDAIQDHPEILFGEDDDAPAEAKESKGLKAVFGKFKKGVN